MKLVQIVAGIYDLPKIVLSSFSILSTKMILGFQRKLAAGVQSRSLNNRNFHSSETYDNIKI